MVWQHREERQRYLKREAHHRGTGCPDRKITAGGMGTPRQTGSSVDRLHLRSQLLPDEVLF